MPCRAVPCHRLLFLTRSKAHSPTPTPTPRACPLLTTNAYAPLPLPTAPVPHVVAPCPAQIDLPFYSSAAILRRQLLLAAENCIEYDLDGGARGLAPTD